MLLITPPPKLLKALLLLLELFIELFPLVALLLKKVLAPVVLLPLFDEFAPLLAKILLLLELELVSCCPLKMFPPLAELLFTLPFEIPTKGLLFDPELLTLLFLLKILPVACLELA